MRFAVRPHSAGLIGKVAGLVGAVAAAAWRRRVDFGRRQSGLRALRDIYRRPAAIPYPKDDPYSRAKYELGRTLFFDPILSGSKVRSCATCHNPGLSWADGQPRAVGEKQKPLRPLRSADIAQCRVDAEARLGWALPRSRRRRYRPDHLARQYEPAGSRHARSAVGDPGLRAALSTLRSAKATSPRPRSSRRWRLSSARSFRNDAPFDRWIAGDPNCDRRRRQARFCSVQRQSQLRGLSQRLGLYRRVVSRYRRRARMTISAAAGCFRHR